MLQQSPSTMGIKLEGIAVITLSSSNQKHAIDPAMAFGLHHCSALILLRGTHASGPPLRTSGAAKYCFAPGWLRNTWQLQRYGGGGPLACVPHSRIRGSYTLSMCCFCWRLMFAAAKVASEYVGPVAVTMIFPHQVGWFRTKQSHLLLCQGRL